MIINKAANSDVKMSDFSAQVTEVKVETENLAEEVNTFAGEL